MPEIEGSSLTRRNNSTETKPETSLAAKSTTTNFRSRDVRSAPRERDARAPDLNAMSAAQKLKFIQEKQKSALDRMGVSSHQVVNRRVDPSSDPNFQALQETLLKKSSRPGFYSKLEKEEVHKIYNKLQKRGNLEAFIQALNVAKDGCNDDYLRIQDTLLKVAEDNVNGKQRLYNFRDFYKIIHTMIFSQENPEILKEYLSKQAIKIALDPRIDDEIITNMQKYTESQKYTGIGQLFEQVVRADFSNDLMERVLILRKEYPISKTKDIFEKAINNEYVMPDVHEIETLNTDWGDVVGR